MADEQPPAPAPSDRSPEDSRRLLETVYTELRGLAAQRLRSERTDHTLQATALVHEAWLRIGADAGTVWANKAHFFAAAAEAMRRILVEHARARSRLKRGGAAGAGADDHRPRRVPLEVLDLADRRDPTEILALEDAVRRLADLDREAFQVVQLRFFAGLTGDEAARVLEVSPRQVDRLWAFARAWLQRELSGPGG